MSNIEKSIKTKALTRRNFLFGATKSLATLAVASAGVYAIGSAFKSLDGSMVAGAKYCACECINIVHVCGSPYSTWFSETCDFTIEEWQTCDQFPCFGNRSTFNCIQY
jgi:hypothetical protein